MKPVFPNGAQSRLVWACSIAGPPESREHCQVGVFLSYVTTKGRTLIDRELYLPLDWSEDRERRQAAGIPESVRFQTKPEQAVRMIERIRRSQIPISWVVADTVYGGKAVPAQLAGSAWVSLCAVCGLC
jgi:SRSO17 transposase